MNQKLITTDKATILLLMLPEGASNIGTELKYLPDRTRILYWDGKNKWNSSFHIDGNWQPLGFAKEVSEEVAKQIMPYEGTFVNFNRFISGYRNGSVLYRIALPAFHSLLQANKVYLVNPYDKPSKIDVLTIGTTKYWNLLEQWEQAQQSVGNWYILKLEK